jgi:hypothetical protein
MNSVPEHFRDGFDVAPWNDVFEVAAHDLSFG